MIKKKSKADVMQTEAETPESIFRKANMTLDSSSYFYIDTAGGSNDSINRLRDKNCVVAYFQFDRIFYMLIQNTSKELRLYRLFRYDTSNYRHCRIVGEQVKEKYGSIFELNFKILNQELFSKFKQTIMLDELTNEK